MNERIKLQNLMAETFQKDLQVLDPEFHSIFIDDLVCAFYNRLAILKKIQASQQKGE
jgi:hypothetical protein